MLTAADKKQLINALHAMARHFDYNLMPEKADDYFQELKVYPLEVSLRAIIRAKAVSEYFPSLNKLLTLADKFKDDIQAKEIVIPKGLDCRRCGNTGRIDVYYLGERTPSGWRPMPCAPHWAYPGSARAPKPDPKCSHGTARCSCEYGRLYGGLPLYNGTVEGEPTEFEPDPFGLDHVSAVKKEVKSLADDRRMK